MEQPQASANTEMTPEVGSGASAPLPEPPPPEIVNAEPLAGTEIDNSSEQAGPRVAASQSKTEKDQAPKDPPEGHVVSVDTDKWQKEASENKRAPNRLSSGRDAGSTECAPLVKHLIPEIGGTNTWQPGSKITAPGQPPVEPGTAVAVFQDGKYTGESGKAHAGIFLGYGKENGKEGILLFDQSNSQDAGQHFFPFDRQGQRGYEAGQFSVIK